MRRAEIANVDYCIMGKEFLMVEKQSKFKGISQQILQSYLQRMAALERVYQQSEEKNYRTFGKYRVKETFAGEESLTSLLTQYVERTVALHY